MTPHIFIASSTFGPKPLQMLKDKGFTVALNSSGKRLNQQELIAQAKGAQAVIAGLEIYDANVLEQLSSLRCISRCGVGIDTIDLTKTREKNITVLNTPQVVIQPVAELTMALMLDLLRRVTQQSALMHQKKWERISGNLLAGKKVGIIGLGRIGRRVAQMLRAWDIDVCAVDVAPDHSWAVAHGIKVMSVHELLAKSDIVSLHTSVSNEHPFCLAETEFGLMKKGAYLVNVSRGSLINEAALLAALQSGHLAGAALDVFEQEPYSGPLCDLPNVILTPHVATLTQESRVQMEIEAAENVISFLKQ